MSGSDSVLLEDARVSANIRMTNNVAPDAVSVSAEKARKSHKKSKGDKRAPEQSQATRSVRAKLINSNIFPKCERPPWLQNDEVFDSLPIEAATMQISQWNMARTMQEQNKIKEQKGSSGKLRADQEVKTIFVEEGEDDAKHNLHAQRFKLRTPFDEPRIWWKLYPVYWPEMNRNVPLEHIGLEHVLSPRTLELLNDRRSIINIKMFAGINVDIGKDSSKVLQRVKQCEDGSTEVQAKDDWLEVANVGQLLEALENLVRVWGVFWPGEFGPSNLSGVISKYRGFAEHITDDKRRKAVLESFINKILSINSSRAGNGKPPLSFKNVDSMAWDMVVGRMYSRSGVKKEVVNEDNPVGARNVRKSEFEELKKFIKDKKHNNKELCIWYNTSSGCKNAQCGRAHVCGYLPRGSSEPCCGSHPKTKCTKGRK